MEKLPPAMDGDGKTTAGDGFSMIDSGDGFWRRAGRASFPDRVKKLHDGEIHQGVMGSLLAQGVRR